MFSKLKTLILNRLYLYSLVNVSNTQYNRVGQKILTLQYRSLYHSNNEALKFSDVGFRIHSQHEEDGIIHYIFSLIGITNMKAIEICAGDSISSNLANLIINHKWIALLIEGDKKMVNKAKKFYNQHPDTKYWPPVILNEWITTKNVNNILDKSNFTGEIDLLSLDIDGIDYWLWKSITVINPRVVVVEFNHLWGAEKAVTVPYDDDFKTQITKYGSDYAGASLSAFIKLGKKKGYRLIGTNLIATNAFFIRNDITHDWLPEIDPSSCFNHPRAQFGIKNRLPGVIDKKWVEV